MLSKGRRRHPIGVKWKLFVYLSAFVALTLVLLWFFQVVFLQDFYKAIKINKVKAAGEIAARAVSDENITEEEMRNLGWRSDTNIIVIDMQGDVLLDLARVPGGNMASIPREELTRLAQLAQDGKYEVRFIELMPIGECADWPRERFLSADAVLHALPELQRLPNEGVAERYRMPGWKGKIGLIRPMSHRFCADCDRIRVTADGRLKPCLHSAQEIPLRGLHDENLERALREGMFGKPVSHHMQSGQPSESRRGMSQIGG